MGRHKDPNKGAVMAVVIPQDVYADIKKLVEIKSAEHGEKYSISYIGGRVLINWVEKQRRKYGEQLG